MNRTTAVVAGTLGLALVLVLAFWESHPRTVSAGDALETPGAQGLADPPNSSIGGASPPGTRPDDDPLEQLVELGAELGLRLDLITPRPDLDALERLRDVVVSGGVDAARLRERARGLPVGDPRRVVLVLAAAWAQDLTPEDEAWLFEAAVGWQLESTDAEQEALAAVWALDLGRRAPTLERVAGDLLERHRGGAAGDESFPGLSRIRTWFALRGLDRFEGPAPLLETWLASTDGEHRVTQELWALAARTDPERWGSLALARAAEGEDAARGGIEALSDERFFDALERLTRDPGPSANELWCASAAWKALVTLDDERARALVADRLASADGTEREVILEALHTWRTPPQPERTLTSMLELHTRLEADAPARERIERELVLRWREWNLSRDEAASARLAAALDARLPRLPGDSEAAALARAWRAELP